MNRILAYFSETWNELKNKYMKEVTFKEFDADKNQPEVKKNKIQGFPTLHLYKNGIKQVFNKERTMANIEEFIFN